MTDTASTQWEELTFHQGDWMRKALIVADMTALEMAEYLEIAPATVSRYLNGKRPAPINTLRVWALRTGVPLSYLKTGIIPTDPENGGRLGELNPRPIHYNVTTLHSAAHSRAA